MPQDFDLRINGRSELIINGQLNRTFDTALDGFTSTLTVDTVNQPELFQAVQPYQGTPCEIYLENELQFTGKITKPTPTTTPNSTLTKLEGFSLPFNFTDSNLTPPYQLNGQNLHELATEVAKQTATAVVFATEPGGIFTRATIKRGQNAFQFLAPLANQRDQVISNTVNGEVIFQQAATDQAPVGTLEEGTSTLQKVFTASHDLRKRFKTYQVSIYGGSGRSSGVSSDSNINEPRHKIIVKNNSPLGSGNAIAEWVKSRALIEELTQTINVIGWRADNKELWQPGQLVTVKSTAMSIPDGFTFFINRVVYAITGKTKTASLSIIPPNVYTGEPIIEPWFQ